jgi:hypothetical protein
LPAGVANQFDAPLVMLVSRYILADGSHGAALPCRGKTRAGDGEGEGGSRQSIYREIGPVGPKTLGELIELAQDIRAARARGEETGLSDEGIAFYDALAENESARQVMGEPTLRVTRKKGRRSPLRATPQLPPLSATGGQSQLTL